MASIQEYLKVFETHEEYEEYITGDTMVTPNVSYCEDAEDLHYNKFVETRVTISFNLTAETSNPIIIGYGVEDECSKVEIDGIIQPNVSSSYTFNTLGEHTIKYTLIDPTTIDSTFESVGIDAVMWRSVADDLSIIIPDNVTGITNDFGLMSQFKHMEIGSGLTYAITLSQRHGQPQYGFDYLETVKVSTNNTKYDSRDNCNAIIETSSNTLVAGTINTIIPSSVQTIGKLSFSSRQITSMTIPNNITSIEGSAFDDCGQLTSITIGSGVINIRSPFNYCENLNNITILATTPPNLYIDLGEELSSNLVIYVPSESVNAYKTASVWNQYSSRIQAIPTT